jgi:hypothetical protein
MNQAEEQTPTETQPATEASSGTPVVTDATGTVLVHVRFAPNGSVTEIGARPPGAQAHAWFNYLSQNSSDKYQTYAGGRGVFRLDPAKLKALAEAFAGQPA